MSMEIERKFLVGSQEYRNKAEAKSHIIQGFLNTDPERTVRIRLQDKDAYLTVKGKSNKSGTIRQEWEFEIGAEEAKQLLCICEKNIIEKLRYLVRVGKHLFEVDEFLGENEGLIIAEVELAAENEDFDKPGWLAEEVTGDVKYYNSNLSKNPYKTWHQ